MNDKLILNKKAKIILRKLLEGNNNFLNRTVKSTLPSEEEMINLAKEQSPIASIVCCSDSRVSPEIIFDQPIGNLFVNRNAGNVINNDVLASLEIATKQFGIPLILVVGHKHCSAVTASLNSSNHDSLLTNMSHLVGKILKANKFFYKSNKSKSSHGGNEYTFNLEEAIIYNIKYGIKKIKANKYINLLCKENKLNVIGSIYDIENGKVSILDNIQDLTL